MALMSIHAVDTSPSRYNTRLRAPFEGRERFARRLRLAPGTASNLPRIGYVSTANFQSARGKARRHRLELGVSCRVQT